MTRYDTVRVLGNWEIPYNPTKKKEGETVPTIPATGEGYT